MRRKKLIELLTHLAECERANGADISNHPCKLAVDEIRILEGQVKSNCRPLVGFTKKQVDSLYNTHAAKMQAGIEMYGTKMISMANEHSASKKNAVYLRLITGLIIMRSQLLTRQSQKQ